MTKRFKRVLIILLSLILLPSCFTLERYVGFTEATNVDFVLINEGSVPFLFESDLVAGENGVSVSGQILKPGEKVTFYSDTIRPGFTYIGDFYSLVLKNSDIRIRIYSLSDTGKEKGDLMTQWYLSSLPVRDVTYVDNESPNYRCYEVAWIDDFKNLIF